MTKIAVICSYPLPTGMAATTRIMAYSKGLVEKGSEVDVYSYIPSGNVYSSSNENLGTIDGINYCYPLRKKRFKNRFLHIIESILSIIISYNKIYKIGKEKKYDAIIISNDNPLILYLFSRIADKIDAKSIFIFDEYPIPIRKHLKTEIPNWKRKLYKLSLKKTNGYISMTNNLLNYYNDILIKPSTLLTSITDIDRFTLENINYPKIDEERIRITYMGNMELSKDNVDNIIKAFGILNSKYKNTVLQLYGSPSNETMIILKSIIN